MWKIGPECAAQQAKKVSARTRNCGERNAWAADMPTSPAAAFGPAAAPAPVATGGRRTSNAAGISRIQAATPMVIIAVRQS